QATLQAIVKKVGKGKIRSVQMMCAERKELRRVGLDYFEEVPDHMS
ncbi:1484_t:CDS:1, partial [Gigaspora rosea]